MLQPLGDEQLLLLQLADARLIGADHAGHAGVEDALQQFRHIPLDPHQLCPEGLRLGLALGEAVGPQLPEHAGRHLEQGLGGLDGAEHRLELALDGGPADGLAVGLAATLGAEIIRMPRVGALRPAGGQRRAAMGAGDEAAQREVLIVILLARRIGGAADAVLDALEGLPGDQPLMLPGPQRHAPAWGLHISGIDRIGEEDADPLVADDAGGILREQRIGLEHPHDVGLILVLARGIAFEGVLHHRGGRLVAHQHLSAPGDAGIFVADRRLEHEIAVLDAGAHAVAGLLAILLTLVLGDRGEQVLHQDGVRVLAELDGGGFQHAAGLGDGPAQVQVCLEATRQAGHVVDEDDGARRLALADEGQHGLHGRALGEAAGNVIGEDAEDAVALHAGELPAAGLLRLQAVADLGLLAAGDAAIDHRLLVDVSAHAPPSFPSSDGCSPEMDGRIIAPSPSASGRRPAQARIRSQVFRSKPRSTMLLMMDHRMPSISIFCASVRSRPAMSGR
ncbi:hypothetical protein V5F58_18415 [Xanthobacter autotrophicus]